MRGSNEMMDRLYTMVGTMLANRSIDVQDSSDTWAVFSYYYDPG